MPVSIRNPRRKLPCLMTANLGRQDSCRGYCTANRWMPDFQYMNPQMTLSHSFASSYTDQRSTNTSMSVGLVTAPAPIPYGRKHPVFGLDFDSGSRQ